MLQEEEQRLEKERLHKEEEEQRRFEEEQLRLVEEARRAEEERLLQAIQVTVTSLYCFRYCRSCVFVRFIFYSVNEHDVCVRYVLTIMVLIFLDTHILCMCMHCICLFKSSMFQH